jgi:hypothetical protein
MAWDYIARFGLDPQFRPVILEALKERRINSGWLFDEAQRQLHSVPKEAQTKTGEIVGAHWVKVECVACRLLEKKTITGAEIRTVAQL